VAVLALLLCTLLVPLAFLSPSSGTQSVILVPPLSTSSMRTRWRAFIAASSGGSSGCSITMMRRRKLTASFILGIRQLACIIPDRFVMTTEERHIQVRIALSCLPCICSQPTPIPSCCIISQGEDHENKKNTVTISAPFDPQHLSQKLKV
jgi:hypothetical protein